MDMCSVAVDLPKLTGHARLSYTVNGVISGFGPLIVSTFGWSSLDAILLQFPLGGICLVVILLTGYLGSRFRNIRIIMLVLCCLPVIAGCAIIWKSQWTYRAAAPVIGYSIIGFFGGAVSLVITIGMSNVAGHTKKSFMAATIFVAVRRSRDIPFLPKILRCF